MGHSKRLLQKCVQLLQQDYQDDFYDFVLERGLVIPGHGKTQPDVQVLPWGNAEKPVCVVEIGYTRASKIAIYRELGIPDIRWYSKAMDLVLCERGPQEAADLVQHELRIEEQHQVKQLAGRLRSISENQILQHFKEGPLCVITSGFCSICDGLGVPEPHDACQFVYFNDRKYTVITECDGNLCGDVLERYPCLDCAFDPSTVPCADIHRCSENAGVYCEEICSDRKACPAQESHDDERSFFWHDEDGPYYDMFDEFVEHAFTQYLRQGEDAELRKIRSSQLDLFDQSKVWEAFLATELEKDN